MSEPEHHGWQTLGSRVAYESPTLVLRVDDVVRPNGEQGTYPVVQLPPAVGIVAINDDGKVALIRQWRYVHRKLSLEIPTGGVEAGEEIHETAVRELAEETGLAAQSWSSLGTVDCSNGSTTDVAHLFLARSVTLSGSTATDDVERTELLWLPFDEAVEMAVRGEIVEAASVAALLRARLS